MYTRNRCEFQNAKYILITTYIAIHSRATVRIANLCTVWCTWTHPVQHKISFYSLSNQAQMLSSHEASQSSLAVKFLQNFLWNFLRYESKRDWGRVPWGSGWGDVAQYHYYNWMNETWKTPLLTPLNQGLFKDIALDGVFHLSLYLFIHCICVFVICICMTYNSKYDLWHLCIKGF